MTRAGSFTQKTQLFSTLCAVGALLVGLSACAEDEGPFQPTDPNLMQPVASQVAAPMQPQLMQPQQMQPQQMQPQQMQPQQMQPQQMQPQQMQPQQMQPQQMDPMDMSPDPFALMMEWPRDPAPLDDPEVVACIERGMAEGTPEACAQCTCQRCMPEANAVYLNEDTAAKDRAKDLVNCGLATCCAGASCFCQALSDGSAIDLNGCATVPEGPCKAEVEAAAGIEGLVLIQAPCEQDTSNPCFQARQLGLCTTGDPIPLDGQPVIGACEAECKMCM